MNPQADSTSHQQSLLSRTATFRLITAAALVMAAGWGIRGAFGHSRGAMMPGAMLGLTLAACCGRRDWWHRGAIIGFLCAIGWGFGGTSSYGLLIGYSMGGSVTNSLYGYACLFLVGALYSGIGASFLAIALTTRRSFLERCLWPIIIVYVTWLLLEFFGIQSWSLQRYAKDPDNPTQTAWLYDTLWICAVAALVHGAWMWAFVPRWRPVGLLIAMLSVGWLVAIFLLIKVTGIRLNPSRGDAWAGCLGIQAALLGYFWYQRNRAALMLTLYGLLAGGSGFVVGDFVQALGRAKWGPIGSYPILQEFGYWTIMEQTFGCFMGAGIALGIARLIRGNLLPPVEDEPGGWLNSFCAFVLLGVMFAFNFLTNFEQWLKIEQIPIEVLGVPVGWVLGTVVVMILLLLAIALVRQRTGRLHLLPHSSLGKVQLLALLVIWMVLAIYLMLPRAGLPTSLMFFAAIGIGTLLILLVPETPVKDSLWPYVDAESTTWNVGRRHLVMWIAVPAVLWLLAELTMQLQIPVQQFRFAVSDAAIVIQILTVIG